MSDGLFSEDDFNFGRAGESGFEPFDADASLFDPRTDRPLGDHGTAEQVIDYILQPRVDLGCPAEDFLKCWREGALDEWPEFYDWLAQQG